MVYGGPVVYASHGVKILRENLVSHHRHNLANIQDLQIN